MSQAPGPYDQNVPLGPVTPPPNWAPGWAVIGIFIILLFAALMLARVFLMPLTMAVLLYFVFAPLRRRLGRMGVPPALTAGGVTLGLIGVIFAIGLVLSGPASDVVRGAPQIADRLEEKFGGVRDRLVDMRGFLDRLGDRASDDGEEGDGFRQRSVASSLGLEELPAEDDAPPEEEEDLVPVDGTNLIMSIASSTPALLGQIGFVLLLLFFMLASGDLLYLKIVQSFATMSQKRRAYAALRQIEESLGSYLGTITIINAGLGLAIGLAMWWWGMPAPAMFGVGAFLLNFIPYIGLILGMVMATAIALVTMDGFLTPLLVGATYAGLSSIEGQLVTPYSVSRRLEMNTVVVFITVALWAWLWSVAGMIVAVPMLVVFRVLCDHIPGLERLGNFLGGDNPPPLGPEGDEIRGEDGIPNTGDEAEPGRGRDVHLM
ncbi:AI-2E family transporter [Frigidibacter albus]|uniref:AI-2E family transporter n=1 Tax=Frigidibacter albus TaxID=1465486 RepID=A0A6L8VJ98_9RHOB|nr:AI-2E family transporter [Frigidibacter albus]MZQ90395.1 AI-2E family transporter [Frigidibacter albus]NBE32485.1 AI-2E family transporter [Frigidibacter albus]GGH59993.1 AI-2E family transporter [Frigidibacter albus]